MTRRAVLLALLAVPVLCLFTQWGDYVVNASLMAGSFPPLGAFFLFVLFVAAVNSLLYRARPRLAFTRAELLLLYAVLGVVSGIPARGLVHFLLPNVTAHRYYATPANHWQDLILGHVPPWIGPREDEVVRALFEGLRPGAAVPWAAWAPVLVAWLPLFLALYVMLGCACALLSNQWIERERLQFPLVDIPLALTETGPSSPVPTALSPFFRDALVWLGALGPFLLLSLESLHEYLPAVPAPNLREVPLDPIFSQHPLRALRPFSLCVYPSVIGLTFLLPAQMSLSFWVFYLLTKLQHLVGALTGLLGTGTPPLSRFPYLEQQGGGAYLALFALFLWTGRRQFRRLLDAGEQAAGRHVLPPRLAVLGLLGSFAVIGVWCHAADLTAAFGLAFFGLYLVHNVVLMRLVAEGGLFWPLGPIQPDQLLLSFTGTRGLPPATIANAAFQMQHVREYRCMFAASLLQAIKLRPDMGDRSQSLLPMLLGYLLLAIAVSLPLALFFCSMLASATTDAASSITISVAATAPNLMIPS